jgi:putative flippase GtrA
MRTIAPFVVVGATAAALHQLTVVIMVEFGPLQPASANVAGFAGAWLVSYLGHRTLTFRSTRPHREAAPRFLAVALLAFAANQTLFVTLLRVTSLHYTVSLFVTLLTVAVGTYLLSARWAFRATG